LGGTAGGRLVSEPGNSSPKKPCSFFRPPLARLFLEPWLLRVVMLAKDCRLSSVGSGGSEAVGFWALELARLAVG
jgi:hypothetical protein